jgi:hypothetical protein
MKGEPAGVVLVLFLLAGAANELATGDPNCIQMGHFCWSPGRYCRATLDCLSDAPGDSLAVLPLLKEPIRSGDSGFDFQRLGFGFGH